MYGPDFAADPPRFYAELRKHGPVAPVELAQLTRTSTTLDAWTLRAYHRYEKAIAGLAASRIPDLTDDDPRPRMIAALTMAGVRISLDDWIHRGGSLPDLIQRALRSIVIGPAAAPAD